MQRVRIGLYRECYQGHGIEIEDYSRVDESERGWLIYLDGLRGSTTFPTKLVALGVARQMVDNGTTFS